MPSVAARRYHSFEPGVVAVQRGAAADVSLGVTMITAKWGDRFREIFDTTRQTPLKGQSHGQSDLLDFSTVLGSMQHTCMLAVWCFALVAIALTGARSLAAESGRAERWTSQPIVASIDTARGYTVPTPLPKQGSDPRASGGNSLRDRIRQAPA